MRPVPNPDAIAFRALKTKSGLSTEHKLADAVGARVRGTDVACGKMSSRGHA